MTALGLMLEDAATRIKSPAKLAEKKDHIKFEQLLGVEIRPDIYVLAVLNMILMGDGSANIINEDSLKDYQGKYEQGANEGKPFPANVFLLNPPYSAAGKGLVFVRDALNRMKGGRAAVLIQENAGSGQGQPFAKDLLKNNTLVASIHMTPKLFIGKSSVQTAIYVFDIGIPHDTKKKVHFIDFEDDGYTRMSRKKASAKVNLRNTGDAIGRYNEVVDIVLGNTPSTHYLDKVSFEDTISLDGDDWTVAKHRKIDTKPTEADFRKTISDYLSWKVSTLLEGRSGPFV